MQHRDIKPANIIVQENGNAVLVDWGLSGLAGVAGHTQTAGYTALFVAPEVFRTGRPDPNGKSDVYCLAASLYFSVLYADTARRATFNPLPLSLRMRYSNALCFRRARTFCPDTRRAGSGVRTVFFPLVFGEVIPGPFLAEEDE